MSINLKFGPHVTALGYREHFKVGKLRNPLKIGVASHTVGDVGVAGENVGEAVVPPTV